MPDDPILQPPVRRRAINFEPAPDAAQEVMSCGLTREEMTRRSIEARRLQTQLDKRRFLDILDECLGIVSYAIKRAGISRRTYYSWYKDDPEFREEVDHINEGVLDFAEDKLLQNIRSGEKTSIIFYLKTKGKSRGYVERHELTGKDGAELGNGVTVTVQELQENVSPTTLQGIINKIVEKNANSTATTNGDAPTRFRKPASPSQPSEGSTGGVPGGTPSPRSFGRAAIHRPV